MYTASWSRKSYILGLTFLTACMIGCGTCNYKVAKAVFGNDDEQTEVPETSIQTNETTATFE